MVIDSSVILLLLPTRQRSGPAESPGTLGGPQMFEADPVLADRSRSERLFGGRLNVRSYITGFIIVAIVLLGVIAVGSAIGRGNQGVSPLVVLVVLGVSITAQISFGVRRLHDHGRSGA